MLTYGCAIDRSYWVLPGRFLAGEYPCSVSDDETHVRLRWLLEQGVDFLIDLTEAGESGLMPYTGMLNEEAASFGRKVSHTRLPIPDMGTPTLQHMRLILDQLDEALQRRRTIYLHCYGGVGRTGTVVGCYLVRHGMNGPQAISQIAQWRSANPDSWKPSPETRPQTDLVLRWSQLD